MEFLKHYNSDFSIQKYISHLNLLFFKHIYVFYMQKYNIKVRKEAITDIFMI